MKICMAGACGRMGRRILELAAEDWIEIGGAFDVPAFAGRQLLVGTDAQHPVTVTGQIISSCRVELLDIHPVVHHRFRFMNDALFPVPPVAERNRQSVGRVAPAHA